MTMHVSLLGLCLIDVGTLQLHSLQIRHNETRRTSSHATWEVLIDSRGSTTQFRVLFSLASLHVPIELS